MVGLILNTGPDRYSGLTMAVEKFGFNTIGKKTSTMKAYLPGNGLRENQNRIG